MPSPLFYATLAPYYDKIYHFIDYEQQAQHFRALIKKFKTTQNNNILDSACGTGTHAVLLTQRGYRVTGLDLSIEMLNEAQKKNATLNLICGDMKKFPVHKSYGIILCYFNSILYNTTLQHFTTTLTEFSKHLDHGGLLIFDMVDKAIGTTPNKQKYVYHEDELMISFPPEWIYNAQKNVLELDIAFTINNQSFHDHHIMGAFSFSEVEQTLKKMGFEILIVDKTIDPWTDKKALFVCRKE